MELINAILLIIFRGCVYLLLYIGDLTGLGYIGINVIIFCIIWPSITLLMLYWIWKLRTEREKLKEEIKAKEIVYEWNLETNRKHIIALEKLLDEQKLLNNS